jgi:hypothetical protein
MKPDLGAAAEPCADLGALLIFQHADGERILLRARRLAEDPAVLSVLWPRVIGVTTEEAVVAGLLGPAPEETRVTEIDERELDRCLEMDAQPTAEEIVARKAARVEEERQEADRRAEAQWQAQADDRYRKGLREWQFFISPNRRRRAAAEAEERRTLETTFSGLRAKCRREEAALIVAAKATARQNLHAAITEAVKAWERASGLKWTK